MGKVIIMKRKKEEEECKDRKGSRREVGVQKKSFNCFLKKRVEEVE